MTSGSINNNVGTTSPVSSGTINDIFPSDDTLYTGTFSGPHGTATCTATVSIKRTGCVGCGGGGLDQPNVQLAKVQSPTDQPLAFVSLSQIPYTGFEAGTLLTLIFWTAVTLWSVGIAYIFVGKGSMRFVANRVLSYAQVPVRRDEREEQYLADVDGYSSPHQNTVMESVAAPVAPVVSQPQTQHTEASEGLPHLTDVIESRAHAAGILLSPEALVIAEGLHSERSETLRIFGDLLNEAVRTIPREDGWILLSAERMRSLIKETGVQHTAGRSSARVIPASSVAPVVDDSAADRFVATLLSGDRNGAFTILHALEQEQASPAKFATGVATLLDKLYRSRKTNVPFEDISLKEKAARIADEGLQQLVEVFAHALDTAYESKYTGLKIAVAQAFDIRSN